MAEELKDAPLKNDEIDMTVFVHEAKKVFKRFFLLLVAVAVICFSGTYFIVRSKYVPLYKAYASFVVVESGQSVVGAEYNNTNNAAAKQLAKTFPYIITSGVLLEVIAEDLGVDHISSTVSADVAPNTNLFTITVTDVDGQRAYDVLKSIMKNYPVVAKYIIGSTKISVIDESGVPDAPSNASQDLFYGVIGGIAGALLVYLGLFVYSLSHKTIHSSEEMKKYTNTKFLGSIPEVTMKKRSNSKNQKVLTTNPKISSSFKESFRLLRSKVIQLVEQGEGKHNIIMITSSIPNEGKTTVSVNLALTLAHMGKKVALIDCDLRNPSVMRGLGITGVRYGLSEVLNKKTDLQSVILTDQKTGLKIVPGSGNVEAAPASLLHSDTMKSILKYFSENMEYVIVDTPPTSIISDVSTFAEFVDELILVVKHDFTSVNSIIKSLETISDTGINVAGYVLNKTPNGVGGYGRYGRYGGYGYGGYGRYGGYGGYGSYGKSNK